MYEQALTDHLPAIEQDQVDRAASGVRGSA